MPGNLSTFGGIVMRKNGLNDLFKNFSEEKVIAILMMLMAILFFMPIVGMVLICKKDSNPLVRAVGAVLLVAGVIIMLRTGGASIGV